MYLHNDVSSDYIFVNVRLLRVLRVEVLKIEGFNYSGVNLDSDEKNCDFFIKTDLQMKFES